MARLTPVKTLANIGQPFQRTSDRNAALLWARPAAAVRGTGCLPVSGDGHMFFQPANAGYECGSVMLTSDLEFAGRGGIFGDPAASAAPPTPRLT